MMGRFLPLCATIRQKLSRWLQGGAGAGPSDGGDEELNDAAIEALLVKGDTDAVESAFLRRAWGFTVAPNIPIEPVVNARFMAAIVVEGMTACVADAGRLMSALRTAEALLHRAIEAAPVWIEPARALGRNYWFQGRFKEAMQAYATAESLREDMARAAGWPVNSRVFLPRNCAEVIGLMGHIDGFVKYKLLTGDQRPYHLLAPPQNVANHVFLNYWKEYIEVESQSDDIARLAPLEPVYGVNWNWVMPKDGGLVFVHAGLAAIQRAWHETGRPPLLRLREEHADAALAARARWGMSEQDRFVCLHVRSSEFYGQSHEQSQRFRNTGVESYYPLIRALTDMGLWVIRMGDASMPPLDLAQCGNSRAVVDYARSPDRCAELDVALCAQCELFVSSPSGLHTVAHAFGRRVCEVNYPIYEGFPWHPDDIFIPQLYYSHEKDRPLALEEVLGTDVIHLDHHFLLERAGLTLIPNEPEDLVETVKEALSPATYRLNDDDVAECVCAAFDELSLRHNVGTSGRLGRFFATKYASKLLPNLD